MDLTASKIVVGVLFGLIRFLAGTLPIKIYNYLIKRERPQTGSKFINAKREQQITCRFALFQSFGGGVLFATCMLHMMPEVYRCVDALRRFGILNTNYPYSQLIVSAGFFLVYFVEEFANWLISITPPDGCKKLITSRAVSPIKEEVLEGTNEEDTKLTSLKKLDSLNELESSNNQPFIIENEINNLKTLELIDNYSLPYENEKENFQNSTDINKMNQQNEQLSKELKPNDEQDTELVDKEIRNFQQIVRAAFIMIALSLNAIFEGLAIGLQHSVSNIWYLFIAVSVHSIAVLFYIGLELKLAQVKHQTIMIYILILSIMSPLGIFSGLGISLTNGHDTKSQAVAVLILEGLSAGTILYITFFEVLNREKELRVYRLRRALFIILGFCTMAVLETVELSR